ncbi:cobyric acid synthase [Bacilli bacterium PM5-3]|nr:cobyric acid synthase [Bacilli bacterium PM5-3]
MKSNGVAILGTASNVGKSTIASAIMRYYANRKFDVVPFKALNITNNLGYSKDSLIMAKSQIIQAQACKKNADVNYNPLLIRPTSTTMELYFKGVKKDSKLDYDLLSECVNCYQELASKHDLVVVEGSGSCAKINLDNKDLANFPLINEIKIPVILVASIEDGGIFANIYGTLALLSKDEQMQVKGIIINKFKGDLNYFNQGKEMLEKLIGKPVIAVLPYIENELSLDEISEKFVENCNMEILNNIVKGVSDV